LGVKRTLRGRTPMSAYDPKQTYDGLKPPHKATTGKKKIRPQKAA
jgi:hypothetical protein